MVVAYNRGLAEVATRLRAKGLSVILFDGAGAFQDIARSAPSLGITTLNEAYLPYDIIDFKNPLAAPKPVPNRAGRSPDEFFSFWAVSASARVHAALAVRARAAIDAAVR